MPKSLPEKSKKAFEDARHRYKSGGRPFSKSKKLKTSISIPPKLNTHLRTLHGEYQERWGADISFSAFLIILIRRGLDQESELLLREFFPSDDEARR